MKRLLLLIITLIISIFIVSSPIAFAEDFNYIKIDSENVGFYLDSESGFERIFYLPQNTYALLLSNVHDYYYSIQYNGITGRIKKSEVPVGTYSNVTKPYADNQITLKEPRVIFSKDNINNGITLLPTDVLTYIGQETLNGTLYYAVKKNNESNIYFVRFNDIYIAETPVDPEPTDTTTPTQPDNNLVKVLLIVGIIIPAVIMVFLLFKPRRRKPRSRRYVEDEPNYRRRNEDYYDDDEYY